MRQRQMSFAELRSNPQRLLRFGSSFCFPLDEELPADKYLAGAQRKARAGQRKFRIEINRFLVESDGGLELLRGPARNFYFASTKIKQISVGVFCRPGCDDCPFRRGERGVQRARNLDCQFALQLNRVGHRPLVAF